MAMTTCTLCVADHGPYPYRDAFEPLVEARGMATVRHRASGRVFSVPKFLFRSFRNRLPMAKAHMRDLIASEHGGKHGMIVDGVWVERGRRRS